MPRIKSASSDMTDIEENNSEREMELVKLQNRYRQMLMERQSLSEESQGEIRRQRSLISSLEKEREELSKEMRLVESKSNQVKDEANCNQLITLAEIQDNLSQRIDEEKAKQVEIESKIREWERKIRKETTKVGGSEGNLHLKIQMTKRIRTLENRLDNTTKKYNSVLTKNSELRKEIDVLRIERKRFDNIYKKLDKAIAEHQIEISELVESSTQLYEQREEARAKLLHIQEKADKDRTQHNQEMKEMVRIIDHDRCLRQFMNMKMSERLEDDQLTTWKARKFKEAEERRAAAEDSVEAFETAFTRIQKLTGERDLDKLVDCFIEKEDNNFALFNYVNEQNNTIEVLTEEIQDLKDQIRHFNEENCVVDTERQTILTDLDEERQVAVTSADRALERLTGVNKILDQLVGGVDSLSKKIGCDRSRFENVLGVHEDVVTPTNIIQHLGLIEQRTNQLLMAQNYIVARADADSGIGFDQRSYGPIALIGEGPGSPPPILPLLPPSLADDFDSEEDDAAEPLSREALTSKVIKTVKKREMETMKDSYHYGSGSSKSKMKGK